MNLDFGRRREHKKRFNFFLELVRMEEQIQTKKILILGCTLNSMRVSLGFMLEILLFLIVLVVFRMERGLAIQTRPEILALLLLMVIFQ